VKGSSASVPVAGARNMTIMSVAKFKRLFRSAASLEVDNADLKRYSDFVHRKTYELL
jgi:hypothetical protein